MFRKTFWFSCALLLCAGSVLSVENGEMPSGNKNLSHSSDQTSNADHAVPSHPDTSVVTSKTADIVEKSNNSNPSENSSASEKNPPTEKPIPVPSEKTTHAPTEKPASTEKPSTSTTTSVPSSSTKSAPSSSSAAPSPTPPALPTSTVIPVTPQPGSQKGSWNITVKNITCLKIDGEFSISYTYSFNNTNTTEHIIVPKAAKATGDCSSIQLGWSPAHNETNTLTFIFKKTNNNTQYFLESFAGDVFLPKRNKSAHFNTNNKDVHFETPLNQSYSCAAMRQINVDNHTKITLEEFHLQAFKVSNTTNFDASVDCAGSTQHTPDIVPIVVGCVLALLVIAVLVAYLISRRRSQTRGYLSM